MCRSLRDNIVKLMNKYFGRRTLKFKNWFEITKNILELLEKLNRTNFMVNKLSFEEKYDLTVDFQILKFTWNYYMKLTCKIFITI